MTDKSNWTKCEDCGNLTHPNLIMYIDINEGVDEYVEGFGYIGEGAVYPFCIKCVGRMRKSQEEV